MWGKKMSDHKESLNRLTIKAVYKYDYYTQYGFQCGKCGYDAGGKLNFPMEECPKCNLEIKTSEIYLLSFNDIEEELIKHYKYLANPLSKSERALIGDILRLLKPHRATKPVSGDSAWFKCPNGCPKCTPSQQPDAISSMAKIIHTAMGFAEPWDDLGDTMGINRSREAAKAIVMAPKQESE